MPLRHCSFEMCIRDRLSGFILKNQKNNGTYHQNQDNSRLEQMLERTNYIAEQTARTSQDYMDFMSKQQSANLKGIQEKLEDVYKRQALPHRQRKPL